MPDSPRLLGTPVLVTGATGFIGSRLAERLATEQGADVTGIGRELGRVAWLGERGVKLAPVDLGDTAAMERAVQGKEVVFHAAAVLDADAKMAQAVNVEATERLVRLAAQAGVRRVVHVSTVGVYDMADRAVVGEQTPLALDHPATYPRTKARAEKRAFELAVEAGVEVAAVRPSMVYGPGQGIWTTTMFRNVCEGKPVFLGDGSYGFNPVYLDDVVDALIRCASAPGAAGEAFNVSSGVTTWADFMGRYGALCGREPKGLPVWLAKAMVLANKLPGVRTPIDQGFIEMATSNKRFPVEKAREVLGWEPTVGLDEGMERTARWLEERGLLP